MPTHWGCLLAGSGAAGGREEGRGPWPGGRRCPAAALLPGSGVGAGRLQSRGRGRRGEPGFPMLRRTRVLRGRDGRPRVRQPQPRGAHRGRAAPSLAQRRQFLLPASPPRPSSPAQRPLERGWCGVGSGEGVFSAALPLVLRVGAGAALTGPGSEPNGTEDAARRGPGCAALQLSPRRRPGPPRRPSAPSPSPSPPSAPAPRLPQSLLSQGWA